MSSIQELNVACPSCNQVIQANWAKFNGALWHWAHLRDDERFGEAVAVCPNCTSYLTNGYVIKTTYQDTGREEKSCGVCGFTHIRILRKPKPGPTGDRPVTPTSTASPSIHSGL
jgi:hypothetical protein